MSALAVEPMPRLESHFSKLLEAVPGFAKHDASKASESPGSRSYTA